MTPLLLWTYGALDRNAQGRDPTDTSKLAPLSSKLWTASLAAALSTFVLIDRNYSGLVPSGVATGASFIAYVSFQSRPRGGHFLPHLNPFEEHVYSLAPRVAGVLLVGSLARVSVFGLPRSSPLYASFLGLVKHFPGDVLPELYVTISPPFISGLLTSKSRLVTRHGLFRLWWPPLVF